MRRCARPNCSDSTLKICCRLRRKKLCHDWPAGLLGGLELLQHAEIGHLGFLVSSMSCVILLEVRPCGEVSARSADAALPEPSKGRLTWRASIARVMSVKVAKRRK